MLSLRPGPGVAPVVIHTFLWVNAVQLQLKQSDDDDDDVIKRLPVNKENHVMSNYNSSIESNPGVTLFTSCVSASLVGIPGKKNKNSINTFGRFLSFNSTNVSLVPHHRAFGCQACHQRVLGTTVGPHELQQQTDCNLEHKTTVNGPTHVHSSCSLPFSASTYCIC